jgi:putative membrane-bound dehydrogenase-like protein
MRWIATTYWLVLYAAVGSFIATASGQDTTLDTADKDYSVELPRISPKSPEEERLSFEAIPGFAVELVAAEPLVADPIAFAFDTRGQLFVVEMKDYSEQETECLGSIALLRDVNGDGKMDERTTFVEGLSWPTAIWPWRDGVLVAEPPRITWFRDTDKDGKSDKSEVWFEGFQRTNVQGLVNSLRWGVDGFIHGASSSSGADIVQNKVQLRGRDFAIDPLTKSLTPETGGGQHGMNFNRWGEKFVTSNSDHLQQIVDLDQWLSEHPTSVSIPSLRRSIAADGPQAEVYRASPVEPWRIVRTRLRMSGVAPGIVEGGGRAAGYFTGATATLIMDHEAGYGIPGFDTAIVCDVGSNLVHRKQLRPNGLFYTANRIDPQTELLRSSDIWFRPVQLGDGPDGAVYIADMYREVIEHPKSLPPMIKKHLDLTSGRDRGRIWRLKPNDFAKRMPAATKQIAACSNKELVVRLASPIAWQRRAASQELVERNAQDVTSELKLTATSKNPEACILALHCLSRLRVLDPATLRQSLSNSESQVQAHAIALLRQHGLAKELLPELTVASSSTAATVQLQVALAATSLTTEARIGLLKRLMSAEDPVVRAIIATAAGEESPQLIAALAPQNLRPWLEIVMPAWTKTSESQSKEIGNSLSLGLSDEKSCSSWLAGLRALPSAADAARLLNLCDSKVSGRTMAFIEQKVSSVGTSESASVEALAWIGMLPSARQLSIAAEFLVPANSESHQLPVIDSLLWSDPNTASALLIDRFQNLTPDLQRAVLIGLMRYPATLPLLAAAIKSKKILIAQVSPDIRVRLLAANDKALGKQFGELLTAVSADRAAIIEQYAPAISAGDAEAGQVIFGRVCAQCHRLSELGNDVGPPLKQLADKSPLQLLETILDPNREVDPKYASYSVLLQDGRVFAGIIAEEASSQIVIAEAGGKKHTIARSDIDQLRSTGVSLMPTGLEQQVTPEQMNHLISFLKKAHPK